MKIVLVTFGSRGDVQPMLALSLALHCRGHQVQLAGPPEKKAWADTLGCPYVPLGADVTAFIDGMPNAYSLSAALNFVRLVRQQLHLQFQLLPRMIAGADLVIGSSLALALPSVADAMGIPYRYIAFTPQLLPSGQHPYPVFKPQRCGFRFNHLTWKFARSVDLLYMDRLINRYRRKLGAKPTPNSWQTLLGKRVVVASDPAVSKVPADASVSGYAQVGYMHLKQPLRKSSALDRFLSSGSAPLYAGFGSMPMQDQVDAMDTIVAAAQKIGLRAVISKFWEGATKYDHHENIFFIKHYPHLDLFPHMAAVIHHGGAGTTATTAASGVPQVIVPQILDQYYWGNQIFSAGLGAKPIHRSSLSVPRLVAALENVLNDQLIQKQVVKVAHEIRPSDSIKQAVEEVLRPV